MSNWVPAQKENCHAPPLHIMPPPLAKDLALTSTSSATPAGTHAVPEINTHPTPLPTNQDSPAGTTRYCPHQNWATGPKAKSPLAPLQSIFQRSAQSREPWAATGNQLVTTSLGTWNSISDGQIDLEKFGTQLSTVPALYTVCTNLPTPMLSKLFPH